MVKSMTTNSRRKSHQTNENGSFSNDFAANGKLRESKLAQNKYENITPEIFAMEWNLCAAQISVHKKKKK